MINFDDSNLVVQYIQNFLKDNYNKNIHLSDVYDKDTHKQLIEYLKLPHIITSRDMKDLMIRSFIFREESPPNKLINGGGIWNFDYDITPDWIRFFSRPINECFIGGLKFIQQYKTQIDDLCREYGWYLANYSTFKYEEGVQYTKQVEFTIHIESRQQKLPSSDIINMINFSSGDYLFSKCFLDEDNKYHGFIQDSDKYKLAYIKVEPGETYTITHGYKYPCELAFAFTEHSLKEIQREGYAVENIVSHLSGSIYGELNPGDYVIYDIPPDSNVTYLLIQMPFNDTLLSPTSKKIRIKVGDVNQDGIIDEQDYDLLNQWATAKENNDKPPFTLSGANLVAANINRDLDLNGNQIVNMQDVTALRLALNNSPLPDLGEVTYEKPINLSESDYDKLLIMYGDITLNNKDNELNIPITDFQLTPWAIHESFLPFILGSAIHTYSHLDDITWLQTIAQKINPNYKGKYWGRYDSPDMFTLEDERMVWDEAKSLWKYFRQNAYTGYVLDERRNPLNGNLRRESNMELSGIQIINGKWFQNKEWTGKFVLYDGSITNEQAKHTLKEVIKYIQLKANEFYRLQQGELIKFITGYCDPLTEKYLNIIADENIRVDLILNDGQYHSN